MRLLPALLETGQLAFALLPADARGVCKFTELLLAGAEFCIVPHVTDPAEQNRLGKIKFCRRAAPRLADGAGVARLADVSARRAAAARGPSRREEDSTVGGRNRARARTST